MTDTRVLVLKAEPEEEPPCPPERGAYARGPHVTYGNFFQFFNVFKTVVKIFVHNEIYR